MQPAHCSCSQYLPVQSRSGQVQLQRCIASNNRMARGVTRITPERTRGIRFVDIVASLEIGLVLILPRGYREQKPMEKVVEEKVAEKPFNFVLLIESIAILRRSTGGSRRTSANARKMSASAGVCFTCWNAWTRRNAR